MFADRVGDHKHTHRLQPAGNMLQSLKNYLFF